MTQPRSFEKDSSSTPPRSAREIEAQLDQTRNALSKDFKALGQKLSTDNLKHEAKVALIDAKDSAKDALVSAAGSAKDAVVDAAVDAKDTVVEAAGTAKDAVVDAAVSAKDTVVEAAGTAKETLEEATEVVAEKLHDYKEVAVETLEHAGETARRAGAASWVFTKQNAAPLALLGLGSAWLIASARSNSNKTRAPRARMAAATHPYPTDDAFAPRARLTDRVEDEPTGTGKQAAMAGRVGQALKRGTAQSRELAHTGLVRSRALVQNNPLAVGAGALSIGIGIGMLLPTPSRANRKLRTPSEAAQPILAAAPSLGGAVTERTRSSYEF